MQAAQDGDARAYARLLKEVAPLLRGTVQRQRPFLDAADVEDVVQETLISVHTARATYDPRRPFLPWLFVILRSRMADLGRRHVRHAAHEVQGEDLELIPAADRGPVDKSGFGDPQLLIRAIRELPRKQRKIVELLKLREMSVNEASAATGMSPTALRVGMHRALVALRKKLTGATSRPRSSAVSPVS